MKWVRVPWTQEAEKMLSDALLSDSSIIKQEVETGLSTLWHVIGHGFFVTRLEVIDQKKELVMVAWQGKNTQPIIKHLKLVCENEGIKSIRFHTQVNEKTASRFVKRWGFSPVERRKDETVYRWRA